MMGYFKKIYKNQMGLTIIELLAAITIGTIVLIIAFSTLNMALNFYKNNMVKSNLEQEENIIVSTMTTLFQQNDKYTINITNDNKLSLSTSPQNQMYTFEKNYKYSIRIDGTAINPGSSYTIMTNKPAAIDITITDNTNPKIQVQLSTILRRL